MPDAEDVRRIALSLPDTVEKTAWSMPTFRVAGKMFATLPEDETSIAVRCPRLERDELVLAEPGGVLPGAQGRLPADGGLLAHDQPGGGHPQVRLLGRGLLGLGQGRHGGLDAVAAGLDGHGERLGLDELEGYCWSHFFESAWLFYGTLNRQLLDEHRLTLFDVQLLDLLAKSDAGSVRMGAVAETLMLPPSRVTAQVRRLEVDGLVQRHASPDDRRGVMACLTQEGRKRLGSALRTYARLVRVHYLGQLTRRQMIALGDTTRRIGSALKSGLSAGPD